jgi:antitoxin Phd
MYRRDSQLYTLGMSEAAHELPVVDARANLADVVNSALDKGEVTYLTRRGQRVAAIVPVDLAAAVEQVRNSIQDATVTALAEIAEDLLDAQAAKAALAEGGEPIPLEELRAELGL